MADWRLFPPVSATKTKFSLSDFERYSTNLELKINKTMIKVYTYAAQVKDLFTDDPSCKFGREILGIREGHLSIEGSVT